MPSLVKRVTFATLCFLLVLSPYPTPCTLSAPSAACNGCGCTEGHTQGFGRVHGTHAVSIVPHGGGGLGGYRLGLSSLFTTFAGNTQYLPSFMRPSPNVATNGAAILAYDFLFSAHVDSHFVSRAEKVRWMQGRVMWHRAGGDSFIPLVPCVCVSYSVFFFCWRKCHVFHQLEV